MAVRGPARVGAGVGRVCGLARGPAADRHALAGTAGGLAGAALAGGDAAAAGVVGDAAADAGALWRSRGGGGRRQGGAAVATLGPAAAPCRESGAAGGQRADDR